MPHEINNHPFFKEKFYPIAPAPCIWMDEWIPGKSSLVVKLSKRVATHEKLSYNDFPSKWDYTKRFGLYEYIFEKESLAEPVNYVEFGVANGESFHWWMAKNTHPESRFYGFDTFTGLPEDFGHYKKGTFATENDIPVVKDERGKFFQGLFQQTLPGFLKTFDFARKMVIMLDADLYTATLFAIYNLAPFLKKGDVILFDEFVVPTHEFKAFTDFVQSTYMDLTLIGVTNNYYFAVFKVS